MSLTLKIPSGDTPDWEVEGGGDDENLNSKFDSSAIHYSLRQSRSAWLTSIFPKFASRSKTKAPKDAQLPPHNLRFIAKCDIEIGPHIFSDSSVYEAHYFPELAPHQPSTQPNVAGYSQTTTYSYPLTGYSPYVGPSTSASTPLSSSMPMDPSLDVSPALIAQVNEAAASNPTLHNLLQSAAAGEASMDQLRTLGFFIQSLAATQQQAPPRTPSTNFLGTQSVTPPSAFVQASQYSPPHSLPKKPDLILEFRENSIERFLVPREIVACEQEIPHSETFRKDIVLYTFVPFLNDESRFKAALNGTSPTPSRSPAVIRFLSVTDVLWESIRGWVNDEAKVADAWESFYDKAEAAGPRSYPQYRLPNGDLLSQLRTACNNGYTMKPIKPHTASDSASARRARARRAAAQAAKNAKASGNTNGADVQAAPTTGKEDAAVTREGGQKRRKTTPKNANASTTPAPNGLYFINTVAPPVPLTEEAGQTPAPDPQVSKDHSPTQPSDSAAP